jgi:hypothetical protein
MPPCMQINSSIISNNVAVGQGGAVAVLDSSTQVPEGEGSVHGGLWGETVSGKLCVCGECRLDEDGLP